MVWEDSDPNCRFAATDLFHVCTNERGWPSNGGPCAKETQAQIAKKEAKEDTDG